MPKVRKARQAEAVRREKEGVKPVVQPQDHGANLLQTMHADSQKLIADIVADLNLEAGNIAHILSKLECAGEICDELHGKLAILRPDAVNVRKEDSYRQIRRDLKSIAALLDSSITQLDECDLARLKRSASALKDNIN